MHAGGDTAADFAATFDQLLQHFAPDLIAVVPESHDLSWWPTHDQQPWINAALSMLQREVDALAAAGVPRSRQVLVGFSQGAIMLNTFALSLARAKAAQEPFAAIVALAGDHFKHDIDVGDWAPDLPRMGSTRISNVHLVSCGREDEHFTTEQIERCAEELRAATGEEIELELLDQRHFVSPWQLGRIGLIVRDVLSAA